MGREGEANEMGRTALLLFTAHTTVMFSSATGILMFSVW